MIKKIEDFILLFPDNSVLQDRHSEWHSPCPFCHADGTREIVRNNVHFYGENRLVWFQTGLYCRVCAMAGRGNGNGFYTYDQLSQRLHVEVDGEFDVEMNQALEEDPLRMLWDDTIVDEAHKAVDREFWYRFNWTDDIIDRFRLGKRILYSADGAVNTIPMQVTHITDEEENYAIRGLHVVAGRRPGLPPKRTPGSIRQYFWEIVNNTKNELAVIAEGEKDGITLASILPEANVYVSFGAASWTKQKTEKLKQLGYKTIYIMGDNDIAGQTMSRNVCLWSNSLGLEVYRLVWDESIFPAKFDVTDILQNYGKVYLENYLSVHMELSTETADAGVTRAVYMSDVQSVIDNSQFEFAELEELRGEGENSLYSKIQEYYNNYPEKKRGRGVLQLLQAPPGAGKTHALIRVAQEIAEKETIKKLAEKLELETSIKNVTDEMVETIDYEEKAALQKISENLQTKLNTFSFASVAWYGQYKDGYSDILATGANPDLWFNFEARNPANCANFETVSTLAKNSHDVGTFCQLACPFKRECMRSGYLSQDDERKKFPITFFRFQHMQSSRAKEYSRLNVIDENPGGLIDNSPVIFDAKDVYPFTPGWELDIEDVYMTQMINVFTSAVRTAMNENIGKISRDEGGIISGAAFLKLVDNNIRGATNNEATLHSVCESLDETVLGNYYQPVFMGGDTSLIKKRCVPQLFATISREMPDFVQNPDNTFPSCIHLIGGQLELYAQNPPAFSSNVPVIAADATAIPLLYDAMFKREVEVYAPRVKNNNAEIIVVHGSDWTKSQIATEIGRQIAAAHKDELDENIYDKRIVRDALTIVAGLAQRHEKLLVVTHKNIRELFEKLLEDKVPNVAWGHYGALRGTNMYTDYEAVALIGAFRIPYDVMYRKISAWAWLLGLHDKLTTETIIKPLAYDGRSEGHGYRTFDNWFADSFVNMVEAGEMIQSAERIRPHSTDKKKYVYIVASRPAVPYVTGLISKNEFMKQFLETKEKELYSFMKTFYITNGDFPSYRDAAEKFATSNSVIQKVKQRIQSEIK